MKTKTGKIGPLKVKISGEGELFQLLINELTVVDTRSEEKQTEDWDLVVIVAKESRLSTGYSPEYSSAKTHMSFNNNTFFHDSPCSYYCQNLFVDGLCTLHIVPGIEGKRSKLRKFLGPRFGKRGEISYSLFWYVVNVLLLQKRTSFIHAGIFEESREATAFLGTGGSGKTSLLFQILEENNRKYMAEDFGMVDADGNVFLSPKTLSIYASDIQPDIAILQTFYKNMDTLERARWDYHTKIRSRNPIRKAPINELFDSDNIGRKSRLKQAFYIVRADIDTPRINELQTSEISSRILSVNLREMKKLVELFSLINANAPKGYNMMTLYHYIDRTTKIYEGAFSKSENYLLAVPFKMRAKDLENFLVHEGYLR